MAIVSHAHKLLFVMTPRTGCTAIAAPLLESLHGEYLPSQDLLDEHGKFRVQRKHCTLNQLLEHGILTTTERQSLFAFGAVRNPFDSLVSLYTKLAISYQASLANPDSWVYKVNGYVEEMEYCRTHSFPEWIARRYAPGVRARLLGRGRRSLNGQYVEGADFVMRFEHLQRDFDQVLAQAGVTQGLTIPRINVTSDRDRDYRRYYTPAARRIVEYVFERELVRFGYEF
jgi:hypothetical protein